MNYLFSSADSWQSGLDTGIIVIHANLMSGGDVVTWAVSGWLAQCTAIVRRSREELVVVQRVEQPLGLHGPHTLQGALLAALDAPSVAASRLPPGPPERLAAVLERCADARHRDGRPDVPAAARRLRHSRLQERILCRCVAVLVLALILATELPQGDEGTWDCGMHSSRAPKGSHP